MSRFASLAAVVTSLAAALPLPAAAQSLRCRSDLANVGDSRASVLMKCGEPVVKDSFCKPAPPQGNPGGPAVVPCESVEEWTYKPGYGQFVTTLRFEGGTLKTITYGDRIN